MVDTPSQPHRAVYKNGLDQKQSMKIRDLEYQSTELHMRMDKNDVAHEKIDEKLDFVITDIKARKLLRWIFGVVGVAVLSSAVWFVITTLQHIYSGNQLGRELQREIERNAGDIRELRRENGYRLYRKDE